MSEPLVPVPPQLPLQFLNMPLTLIEYDDANDKAVMLDPNGRRYRMVGHVAKQLGLRPGNTFDFGMYKHQIWLGIYKTLLERAEAAKKPWWKFW